LKFLRVLFGNLIKLLLKVFLSTLKLSVFVASLDDYPVKVTFTTEPRNFFFVFILFFFLVFLVLLLGLTFLGGRGTFVGRRCLNFVFILGDFNFLIL